MNCYAGLDDLLLRGELGRTAQDQAVVLQVAEAVSRSCDKWLERRFYHEVATAYFDGNGMRKLTLARNANEAGRGDLLSVTTVKVDDNRDGVYELELTQNTDYRLTSKGEGGAYRQLEALPELSVKLGYWPAFSHCIEVAGVWGFSDETETAGELAAALDPNDTSITLANNHLVQAGNTIVIGSEQIFVRSVSDNTLTRVERAVNGTSAGTANSGTGVARRRYPREIEQVVAMETARLVRDGATGFSGQSGNAEFAGYAFSATYPAIKDLKAVFHPTGFAVVA